MKRIRDGRSGARVTLLSTESASPKRGEIWIVNLDPTVGAEMKKVRPAVVVSADAIGRLPIKLVAPITDWKDHYGKYAWMVRIEPNESNRLEKISAVDVLQLRGLDIQRFVRKLGRVSEDVMADIAAAVALVVEYE